MNEPQYGFHYGVLLGCLVASIIATLAWIAIAGIFASDTVVWSGSCTGARMDAEGNDILVVSCEDDVEIGDPGDDYVRAILVGDPVVCERIETRNGGVIDNTRTSYRCRVGG